MLYMAGGKLVLVSKAPGPIKKGKQYTVKKVSNKKKKTSTSQIVNNVIKQLAEKKHDDINLASTDYTMGQVAGNANGYFAADVTPYQIPGSNSNQHTGFEISIISFNMQYQIRQMSASTAPCKVKFYLFRCNGTNTETASALVGNLFNYNQFIGGGSQIFDYNSAMNMDYMGNYRLLRRWTAYLKPDSFSGQQMPKTGRIGGKFKKPLKVTWFTNTAGAYSQGRIILVALPDIGNASTTTASTLTNLPVTAANTGQFLNFSIRWYYNDL